MVDEHGSPGRFQPLNKKLTLEVSKHRKLPATKCPKGENPKNSRKKNIIIFIVYVPNGLEVATRGDVTLWNGMKHLKLLESVQSRNS